MAESTGLRALQYRFAAHLRDPEHAPPPEGVEDRRMAVYRELFFNNVSQLLARSFPVLRKILGDEPWQSLVRDWFVQHRAATPLFLELPREFLDYLERERAPGPQDPPFLLELAHYEWVELALSIHEASLEAPDVDPDGDLLDGVPVLSPLAWPLAYRFPVHRLSPGYRPDDAPPEPTRLVVYRGRDERVGFLEINVVTARLLELLGEPGAARSGREVLTVIAAELGHPRPEVVVEGGAVTLAQLKSHDVVLGVRRATPD